MKRIAAGLAALLAAAFIWLPCLHFFFAKPAQAFRQPQGLSPGAVELAARHLQLWSDAALRETELKKMRVSNAEWDFMGRTFLVWSLVNMGLREPGMKGEYLPVIDQIIQETVKIEKQDGIYAFLMPYAKARPYQISPARSLFLDWEIALMMGARRMLQEEPGYKQPMTERLNVIEQRMRSNPLMAMESYPDECWTFDDAVALVAFKVADRLDGQRGVLVLFGAGVLDDAELEAALAGEFKRFLDGAVVQVDVEINAAKLGFGGGTRLSGRQSVRRGKRRECCGGGGAREESAS